MIKGYEPGLRGQFHSVHLTDGARVGAEGAAGNGMLTGAAPVST